MPPTEIFEILRRANTSGSRSTVLAPLGWLAAILASLFGIAATRQAPPWAIACCAVFLGVVITLYIAGYVYFALTAPDALRSERYTLSKMAMERGLIGDDLAGLIPDRSGTQKKLPQDRGTK